MSILIWWTIHPLMLTNLWWDQTNYKLRGGQIEKCEENNTNATNHCHKAVSVHFRYNPKRLVTSRDFASDFAWLQTIPGLRRDIFRKRKKERKLRKERKNNRELPLNLPVIVVVVVVVCRGNNSLYEMILFLRLNWLGMRKYGVCTVVRLISDCW